MFFKIRPKRKRKLIVDEIKAISGEDMKGQLSDTYDIVIPLDLAPPTKKLMFMKEVGATEKLFSLPGNSDIIWEDSKLHVFLTLKQLCCA